MSGLPSDDLVEDYKISLEDLTTNDRFQINNLTVIARENTEHAMAISRVLENHIGQSTPSSRTLEPPYTLFLGQHMYQTFMNAYATVDQATRRKLDEMLKTWKEPVPGSLDTRPVFSSDITRTIENALIRARTAAIERERPQAQVNRGRGTPTGRPNNNTPPQGMPRPPPQHANNGRPMHTSALIAAARTNFANSPFDPASQARLKALLDLQSILQNQQLTTDQIKLVRDQVSAMATSNPVPNVPVAAPPIPVPAPVSTPPAQPSSQSLQSLLNSSTLADLIKATATRQQPTSPPQIPNAFPQMLQMPPVSSTPQPAENPLIAQLRARGLLPSHSAPPVMSSSSPPPMGGGSMPFFMPGQPHSTPPAPTPPQAGASSVVPMKTAFMKFPRLNLVVSLYDAKSNRCGTCGRRFPTTAEGKEKKARHLDWHFKTNQRMVDASKRAQNRSCDDSGPADTEATTDGEVGADGKPSKQGPPKAWIRAPNDAKLRNTPCPICQEMFESTWSEDVQDWIWQDAIKVASRVYHASCYAEVTANEAPRSSTPQGRSGTPDSILGKRKAEGNDSPGLNVRIKMEPA
ncbi:mRNA cleavage factor complex component Pcf11 [Penicillium waksmanii]|uniref:mRNA cleavage factor complex component Pcf11 n=1 Tax=Penicillium waksmanii TaxID=69791 RepID=UPI0025499FD7|nr:mRNA cleavage factor complex component Pcf11 [Penicillium waksmanii]KAJ5984381.1 mRNA cleavage factor complex component Pcf11 [Penicillium waksmanii]